ncbi:MAG: STAS domain-containing protein [Candidatus Cloacimonadaceae bacterium]|jgi:anti-sigma B factor antagonist|nr:STAS domain-containing protein [Candidatus Cloacimonadota bacterium]MDX9949118.1 STAS domain-containing protein [Candidatus Syntrophosphaera sp.]NLN85674.1 STAS domain-containing protein [Candidatus Cloacimonadota bacterium]
MKIDLSFSGDRALMTVEGYLNSENADNFQKKLNEVLDSQARYLDIDLFECKNISSIGIGKLLLFYKDFVGKGGELEVIRSSEPIFELFNTLKLNQLFLVNLE